MLSFAQIEKLQQEKQPVYVKTPLFQGLAIIDYVADVKEMFPVQVVLQESDEDGHRLKRVALAELSLPGEVETKDYQSQQDERQRPLFTGADDKTRYLVEVVHEYTPYRLFKGEKYIVGPTRDNCEETFLVYSLEHTWRGRFPREWFRILSVYDDSKGECIPVFSKRRTKEEPKTEKETAAKTNEPERFEQLSFELEF